MHSRVRTTVMRSVIVAGLTLTGAGLLAGCAGAGGGGELTSATAAGLIEAHPEFQNPANLGVYGGTPELIEVSSISAEGGSRATAEFTWMYNRDFQGTKGNVPSTLYYTRMLDGRPREASAVFSSANGEWAIESLGSLWESIRASTPVAGTTYDDPR